MIKEQYLTEELGGETEDLTFESTYCSISISKREMLPSSAGGRQQTGQSGGSQMNPDIRMKLVHGILTAKDRRELW